MKMTKRRKTMRKMKTKTMNKMTKMKMKTRRRRKNLGNSPIC